MGIVLNGNSKNKPMLVNSTSLDLLHFVYNETEPTENQAILAACDKNFGLAERLAMYQQSKKLLSLVSDQPRAALITSILNYSKDTAPLPSLQ